MISRGKQTNLSSGKHGTVGSLLDVLEELGLGGSGVSEEEHVDVSPQPVLALDVLGLSSKKGQRNAGLDVLVPIN